VWKEVPKGSLGGEVFQMESMQEKRREGTEGEVASWNEVKAGVRNSMRREIKAIVGPRGSRSGRMMERGKKEEVTCKIAEGTEGIKCEGEEEEEDLGRVEMGDDRFVVTFSTSCFVVRLVYKGS
jgi:hypothetical protein